MSVSLFNNNQNKLHLCLKDREKISEMKSIFVEQNALIHPSPKNSKTISIEDDIWKRFDDKKFRAITIEKQNSIAWHLLHSARIEDIVVSCIITHKEQLFTKKNYRDKMNIPFIDTGTDYGYDMMLELNQRIVLSELKKYRIEAGTASKKAITNLTADDIKRKVSDEELEYIAGNDYVRKESQWLLDFWGRKNIAGLIIMPLTRHILIHLNKARSILDKKW